jgi:transcriptional regulator GlxA family with amidase domain
MPTTRNLAVVIFEGVEVLDFSGPFEVFAVANRFTDPRQDRPRPLGHGEDVERRRGGLSANPHRRLSDIRFSISDRLRR